MRQLKCQYPGCNVCSEETMPEKEAVETEVYATQTEGGCIFGQTGDTLQGVCKLENWDFANPPETDD